MRERLNISPHLPARHQSHLHAHLVDRRVQKQAAIRVEQLLANDGVELSCHAAGVKGRLADELEAEDLVVGEGEAQRERGGG